MTIPDIIPPRANPLVQELYARMISRGLTDTDVSRLAGVAPATIRGWRTRATPRVDLLEAALNAVGLRLVIAPMSQQYNAQRDLAASLDACYGAIRERVAQGGEPWKPR